MPPPKPSVNGSSPSPYLGQHQAQKGRSISCKSSPTYHGWFIYDKEWLGHPKQQEKWGKQQTSNLITRFLAGQTIQEVDHPLKFCPMLGKSKYIQALLSMLSGRTRASNHWPVLEFPPPLTPKLDPATRLDGTEIWAQSQGWKGSPPNSSFQKQVGS